MDIQGVIIIHCHLTSSVKAYRSIHLMFARQAYTCAIHILARISACLKKKQCFLDSSRQLYIWVHSNEAASIHVWFRPDRILAWRRGWAHEVSHWWERETNYIYYIFIYYLFIWKWCGGGVPWHMCVGQRTTCGSSFSPFTMESGDQTQVIKLGSKCLVRTQLIAIT